MASAFKSRRTNAENGQTHSQHGPVASFSRSKAKRKRDGSRGSAQSQESSVAATAGNEFPAVISGRVAVEIKAALTDALDAFCAVRNLSWMRETLYLRARFFHACGCPDLRNQASEAFLSVEREMNLAKWKHLKEDFLETTGLDALAEEWQMTR